MGHNSKDKPGPTIAECEQLKITHLRVKCKHIDCRHEDVVAVATIKARRDVPVTEMRWRCDKRKGGCGRVKQMHISAIFEPPKVDSPHPIFVLSDVKAKPRRVPMLVRRSSRGS
jgi:hypothetical protein